MTTDPLVGNWRLEGTSIVIHLRDDGRATFFDVPDREFAGHWRRIDEQRFETVQIVPDPVESAGHHLPSRDYCFIRRIVEFQPDRLFIEIVESSDGDFDYDPEVWLRVKS